MKASPIRLVALLAKSMFVAGALGLASLLPNNAKAVPTEWSSIADIIAQAPEGFSAEYYASPDGASDAECTAEAPGTIQAAVNKASQGSSWGDGDTVILLPGTYNYTSSSWNNKNCVTILANQT